LALPPIITIFIMAQDQTGTAWGQLATWPVSIGTVQQSVVLYWLSPSSLISVLAFGGVQPINLVFLSFLYLGKIKKRCEKCTCIGFTSQYHSLAWKDSLCLWSNLRKRIVYYFNNVVPLLTKGAYAFLCYGSSCFLSCSFMFQDHRIVIFRSLCSLVTIFIELMS
jgi:hypothetical protein